MIESSPPAIAPLASVPSQGGATAAGGEAAWSWRRPDPALAKQAARGAAQRRGLIGGTVGLVVAGLFYFAFHRHGMGLVVAAIALLTTAIALLSPGGLYPRLERLFEAFGRGVGTAVTWVLMIILHFVLFLPVGLVLRATGNLDLHGRSQRDVPSFWQSTRDRQPTAESYRKQF